MTIEIPHHAQENNVPDDWNQYWITCERGHKYHASEGGCGCRDSLCDTCDAELDFDGLCPDCLVCDGCGELLDDDERCSSCHPDTHSTNIA